ncbi:hypothetical protein BG004_001210 [Podila humilis]|nr:hypothetical protein BG004_001210 [Podila humilis]
MKSQPARSSVRYSIVLFLSTLLLLLVASSHAQPPVKPEVPPPPPPPPTTPTSTSSANTSLHATPTISSPSSTDGVPPIAETTAGYAKNPHPPGTINCFNTPKCADNEECYVLDDGLVCLNRDLNWGYILARNESGVPSVPSWRGPRSTLNANCSYFQLPDGKYQDMVMQIYDLIGGTIPKDLYISEFDKVTVNWYTWFSNCGDHLSCNSAKCQPRPQIGQPCTSSWQCNPHALGLNENNYPISTANETQIRCEYKDGFKSANQTCQLLHRDPLKYGAGGFGGPGGANGIGGDGGGISAWQVILPVVLLLVLIYFGAVLYQRRKRKDKLRKWSRRVEDGNDFHMETYDEIR